MRNYFVLIGFLCSSYISFAFVPDPGQLARFQPLMRKVNKTAFLATGDVSVRGNKLNYELRWFGPKSYQVTIHDVPSAFGTSLSTSTGTWILKRQDGDCSLVAGGKNVSCPPPRSWAQMEIVGDPFEAPSSLEADGLFSPQDKVYNQTNSKNPETLDTKNRRVTLEIGNNGMDAKAVLQVKGPGYSEEQKGKGFPLIQFDQSFLAPLLSRFRYEGTIFTLEATSDLTPRKGHSRFQPILSHKLRVFRDGDMVSMFTRNISTQSTGNAVGSMKFKEGLVSVDSLRAQLSSTGEILLDSLLLTH